MNCRNTYLNKPALCASTGRGNPQPNWEMAPGWEGMLALKGGLLRALGPPQAGRARRRDPSRVHYFEVPGRVRTCLFPVRRHPPLLIKVHPALNWELLHLRISEETSSPGRSEEITLSRKLLVPLLFGTGNVLHTFQRLCLGVHELLSLHWLGAFLAE